LQCESYKGFDALTIRPFAPELVVVGWVDSITNKMFYLWSSGRGFNSWSGHHQMVSAWMGEYLRTVYNPHWG